MPAQIVLSASDEAMVTLTGWLAVTAVAISLLVAGLPVPHGVTLDVSTTLILSPSASAVVVKVGWFNPTLVVPFFFH